MSDEAHAHLTGAGEYDCAPEPLPTLRHSTAHLLAQAATQLFPEVRLAIGPPIENGFYYDFQRDTPFTEEDLARLEERMRELAKADYPIVREERSREEAIRFYRDRHEPFKVEILEALPPEVTRVSFYRQGEFVDLCRGPHVPSTGHIHAFKLLSSSGAYWRGDEHRPMLQRIYGTAWPTQEELDRHLWRLAEAKRRDHRKLGRELELFAFHDVSPGAPFWLPKGMIVFRELERFARELQDARGYQEVSTPILVNRRLWEQSGHWEHYAENMFRVEAEEQVFALKPMNCPESTFMYRHALRSYRDLPLRFAEMGRLHRNERSGTLTGLFRVRQFTQDDAHIYCRPDQLQAEIMGVLELVGVFYRTFGLEPQFKLATRPDRFLGTPEQWDHAERALEEALRANGLPFTVKPGDGAFYAPKIDIHIEDVLGRDWQMATIQADLTMLPERFALEYVDADGQPKRPVAIHRAIFGSFERFIGILIEQFGGAFPTWLAPVQVRVLPVSARHGEYAVAVHRRLVAAGVRAELDDRSEKLGYRVREAQLQKLPYALVVGEREARDGTASVRKRGGEDVGAMPVDAFLAEVTAEIRARAVTSRIGPERG
ncbi:MAG TPA: threonine--tRNA ligase [Methylomirabilota bacterium]|jgi:threonyl-tRNA synthetase|nr:threonine--tRNA ligase [Methylomirabilota bacterium]